MNKVREIHNRLVKWVAKRKKREWRIFHTAAILLMAAISVLGALDFCNYVRIVVDDKSIILKYSVLFLVIITAMYLFWRWRVDKKHFEWLIILMIIIVAVLGAWDAYHCKCLIGKMRPITLEYLVGFLLTITTIYLFLRRVKNQEEQIKIESFTAAVGLLGSDKPSARIGAIYSLYQQAVEHEKYRKKIVQILCSHIRSTTKEQDYQKQYKIKPSDEIQTAIDLLFKKTESTAGLYPQFGQQLPKADLSHAYCVGANFSGAYCKEADFRGAYFQGADFHLADCRGAGFRGAYFQGADFHLADCRGADFAEAYCKEADFRLADFRESNFKRAHCEKADFRGASCEEAKFFGAHCERTNFYGAFCKMANFRLADCQEVDFREAHCWEADFSGAHCQGANFFGTNCEGANFRRAHCEGADFGQAHCEGVNFKETHCQGADFKGTHCQGAHGSIGWQLLKNRINKDTELDKVIITEGALPEKFVNAVQQKEYPCSLDYWYPRMQKIIEENNDKEEKCGTSEDLISRGMNVGKLKVEDGDKMQSIIEELEDRRKAKFSRPQ